MNMACTPYTLEIADTIAENICYVYSRNHMTSGNKHLFCGPPFFFHRLDRIEDDSAASLYLIKKRQQDLGETSDHHTEFQVSYKLLYEGKSHVLGNGQ